MLGVLGLVGGGGLLEQLGNLLSELGVGAVGRSGGVGGHLGAVQGHQAHAHHAGGRAQLQRGHQEAGQGLLMADPEAGEGDVVGGAVTGQDPEGDVLVAAAFELAGGADPVQ